MKKRKQKFLQAQSTNEFAIILAVVAAALIGMQVYVKRGIQGRIRDLADQISGEHYEPQNTTSNYTLTQSGTLVNKYLKGVTTVYQDGREGSAQETITRSGYETVDIETR